MTKSFARFARKEGLDVESLRTAVRGALSKPDANLGGEVVKQRVARVGQGKSGGYRTIILLRCGERAVFVHGFAKSEADNISAGELKAFKKLAPLFLDAPDSTIKALILAKELVEVKA